MPSHAPQPSPPDPATTLILVRQNELAMETYLLQRSAASRFMPGTYVFPGGRLEDEDRDTDFWINHVDLSEKGLMEAFDSSPETILPFAVAAIRETWEEAGVLLAEPMATGMTEPGPRTGQVDDRPVGGPSFKQLAEDKNLILSTSKMAYWSRWITPQSMPKRFDTCFFMTPVKPDQECRPDNRETVDGIWLSPRKALIKNLDGSLPLSPPAVMTLHQMLSFADLSEMIADTRRRSRPAAIMPRLWPLGKGALLIQPWDPDYERDTVRIDENCLQKDVLPVGEPFSRLWFNGGVCRPVRNPDSW